MDFHLRKDVRERNGLDVGYLRHVVCDPETREVISLVVQLRGLEGHVVILPIGAVETGDEDAVYTRLTSEQFDQLDTYDYERNVAPPPAEYDEETSSSDQVQEPIDVPDVPPVGAAEGITSVAYTPILEIWRNVPDGSLIFDETTVVEAKDGELGHVRHVLADDETRRLSGFIVEKGFLFTRDIEVPMDLVARMRSDRILLRVARAEVDVPDEELPGG